MQRPGGTTAKTVSVRNWIIANNGQGSVEGNAVVGET